MRRVLAGRQLGARTGTATSMVGNILANTITMTTGATLVGGRSQGHHIIGCRHAGHEPHHPGQRLRLCSAWLPGAAGNISCPASRACPGSSSTSSRGCFVIAAGAGLGGRDGCDQPEAPPPDRSVGWADGQSPRRAAARIRPPADVVGSSPWGGAHRFLAFTPRDSAPARDSSSARVVRLPLRRRAAGDRPDLPGLKTCRLGSPRSVGQHGALIPPAPPVAAPHSDPGRPSRRRGGGRKPSGVLNLPANSWNAGWYKGSPVPGAPGDAVIEGHAGYPNQPMIFGKLATLETGAPDRRRPRRQDRAPVPGRVGDQRAGRHGPAGAGYAYGRQLSRSSHAREFDANSLFLFEAAGCPGELLGHRLRARLPQGPRRRLLTLL